MPSDLSENEFSVLKAISEGLSDPQSIAQRLNMKVETARAAADTLAEQELIQVHKSVDESISLTTEGTSYAREGLPERRLLLSLGTGKAISELKDPALKIGLGWLRKKGWAAIEGGVIRPIGTPKEGEDERMLKELLSGPKSARDLDEGACLALKSRGLVKSETTKSWKYQITDSGRSRAKGSGSTGEAITGSAVIEIGPITLSSEAIAYRTISNITADMIKTGQWREVNERIYWERDEATPLFFPRPYDVSLPADRIFPGKRHPYQRLIDNMREIMLEMGFVEIKGPIVQTSFWNFDALFQPQDHPAREMQDTFYLESQGDIPDYSRIKQMHECGGGIGSTGWGGCWSPEVARQEVLRTHTTGVTIKYLAEHPRPPVKAFGIDRVYRREAIDSTHTPEFEQLEGIVMDEDVSFSHLLGILKEFYEKMGFPEVRFRPGYFPYTEPSVEPEVYIEGLGWVELGGAGVFRKEVTSPFGIDHPVLAWGLGVSRVAMLRLGLKDLRLLYQSDIEWLRRTPVSIKL